MRRQTDRQTDKRGRNIHTIFVSSHKTYTVRHVAHRKMPQLPRRSIDQSVDIDVGCRVRRASRSVAPSATRTETMYQEMKTTYGTNSCHLLQINSRHPSTAHQMDSSDELVGTLPDPWAQFLPRKSASMVRSPGEKWNVPNELDNLAIEALLNWPNGFKQDCTIEIFVFLEYSVETVNA